MGAWLEMADVPGSAAERILVARCSSRWRHQHRKYMDEKARFDRTDLAILDNVASSSGSPSTEFPFSGDLWSD